MSSWAVPTLYFRMRLKKANQTQRDMRSIVALVCLASAADAFGPTTSPRLTASVANVGGRATRGVVTCMTAEKKQVTANTKKVQDFLRRRQGSSKLAPTVVNPPPMPELKRHTLRSMNSGALNSLTDFGK